MIESKIIKKPLTSKLNKLLFGSHFYPYHITLWLSVSSYNLYYFVQNEASTSRDFVFGFFFSSFITGIAEYSIHRIFLHKYLYKHHKKHHTYPNRLSIIHTPMLLVVCNFIFHFFYLHFFVNVNVLLIFIPLYYLSFEMTHLISHSYKGQYNVMLNAKYYHKLHHIDETTNYGFITPYWDYFFGTLSSKYKISFTELLFGFIPFYSFIVHKKEEF